MTKFYAFGLIASLLLSGSCLAADPKSEAQGTSVLGYTIGKASCSDMRRDLSPSHPEMTEGEMSDLPKKYRALTTNAVGLGVVGLTQASMICDTSGRGGLRGASLLFDAGVEDSIFEVFNAKYTTLNKSAGATLYKTPGGVLMVSSTPAGLRAIYADMGLFQDLSDMASGAGSKL